MITKHPCAVKKKTQKFLSGCLQGDVIALIDSNDKKGVEYKYDAWGSDVE